MPRYFFHVVWPDDLYRDIQGIEFAGLVPAYWYAIGLAEGRPITVIYTDVDDETRRIISAWKAEKHGEKAYFDHLEAKD